MEEPQEKKIQAKHLLLGPCRQGFSLSRTASTSFKTLYSHFQKRWLDTEPSSLKELLPSGLKRNFTSRNGAGENQSVSYKSPPPAPPPPITRVAKNAVCLDLSPLPIGLKTQFT